MIRRSARLAGKKRPKHNEESIVRSAIKDRPNAHKKSPKRKRYKKKDVPLDASNDQLSHGNCKPLCVTEGVKQEPVSIGNTSDLKYVGAHTSISGGLWKSVEAASAIGAKAFGLFLRNQQQWKIQPMAAGHAQRFKDACEKYGYKPQVIVPHGSYLMNCGSFRDEVREKSQEMLIDELKRCEDLGLLYFNFHPGSTLGKMPIPTCVTYIAKAINKAHRCTKYVVTLLENMSCQGNTLGGKLEELRDIINEVEDKSRVGVCIDTCHAHAAGYDLSTSKGYESLMYDLETIVGFKYVKAIHLNDSKGPAGCHLDRHENIGRGTIGLSGFERVMNDPRLAGIPMILETPLAIDDAAEIKLLYSLQKT